MTTFKSSCEHVHAKSAMSISNVRKSLLNFTVLQDPRLQITDSTLKPHVMITIKSPVLRSIERHRGVVKKSSAPIYNVAKKGVQGRRTTTTCCASATIEAHKPLMITIPEKKICSSVETAPSPRDISTMKALKKMQALAYRLRDVENTQDEEYGESFILFHSMCVHEPEQPKSSRKVLTPNKIKKPCQRQPRRHTDCDLHIGAKSAFEASLENLALGKIV